MTENGNINNVDPNNGEDYIKLIDDIVFNTVKSLRETFREGKSKGKTSLWTIGSTDHADRALSHVKKYLQNDTSDSHLSHALWRIAVSLYFERLKELNIE